MNHVKVLDCTLRDGAYIVGKKFGDDVIRGIIKGLMKTKIDIIEIGFFQDEGFGKGKTVFKNSADARKFIPPDKQGREFTVLADCSRFSVNHLDDRDCNSIDGIRECFFKREGRDAVEACRIIKEKGYKCYVQPVDILGYSDIELIELINLINKIEPYCFSIVDTFGSMYQDDLHRVFEIINHNLVSTCKIGFHSHNNLQMSNALAQEFIQMALGKREAIIDSTISGMGRGAGNTPTELIIQYLVSKWGYDYNVDALLDIIDIYMDNLRTRCDWGYSTPNFVAGSYGAHVNNISYLLQKNSIKSKDIRYILNKIEVNERKRYNYALLEQTYINYMMEDIDDTDSIAVLGKLFSGKDVLILVPGHSVVDELETIKKYIAAKRPLIISVNFLHDVIKSDYIYINNFKRYHNLSDLDSFKNAKKIIASNIKQNGSEGEIIVSFVKLVKCGWEHLDNSTIMLLRLLDKLEIKSIGIAGFDGYDYKRGIGLNYASEKLELANVQNDPMSLNEEILSMLKDYNHTRKHSVEIRFVTQSRFENVFHSK